MKRKKNIISLIFVLIALLAYIACMILVYYDILKPYFPDEIMNFFNKISVICLGLFIATCIISLFNFLLKKRKNKKGFIKFLFKITNVIDKHKISIITFLFAITIISVNAHIALWIPAVICSFALSIASWE